MVHFSAYGIIFVSFIISAVMGSGLYFVSYFFIPSDRNYEKLSSYECGFDPFSDISVPFEVSYYLVSILFMMFDLEVAFLFPWAVVFYQVGFYGFFSVMLFLAMLAIGFVYEWLQGALEWSWPLLCSLVLDKIWFALYAISTYSWSNEFW